MFKHDKTPIICQCISLIILYYLILFWSCRLLFQSCELRLVVSSHWGAESFKATSLASFYLHHRCPALQKMFLVPSASHPNNPPIHNGFMQQEMFNTCLAYSGTAMRFGPMLISFSVACIPSRKTRTFFRNMLCLQFAPGSGTRIQIKIKIITQYTLGSRTVLSWQSEVMVTVCHRSERRYLHKSCKKATPPNFCIFCAASEWQCGLLAAALHLAVLNMDTSSLTKLSWS